jgi:hypothetical protein
MTDWHPSFERQVRAVLTRLHDLPYLQTHALGGLRGTVLKAVLTDAVEGLRSEADGAGGRTQRLLVLRYVEGLDSTEVAADSASPSSNSDRHLDRRTGDTTSDGYRSVNEPDLPGDLDWPNTGRPFHRGNFGVLSSGFEFRTYR